MDEALVLAGYGIDGDPFTCSIGVFILSPKTMASEFKLFRQTAIAGRGRPVLRFPVNGADF